MTLPPQTISFKQQLQFTYLIFEDFTLRLHLKNRLFLLKNVLKPQLLNNCRKSREKMNNTLNQLDQMDIYWTLPPAAGAHTFFLSEHGTFTKTDQGI